MILRGHLLASVFIVLLPGGARGFLGAQPVLSSLLLVAFAPVYLIAARVTGARWFLYPAVLLPALAYHPALYGAGSCPDTVDTLT